MDGRSGQEQESSSIEYLGSVNGQSRRRLTSFLSETTIPFGPRGHDTHHDRTPDALATLRRAAVSHDHTYVMPQAVSPSNLVITLDENHNFQFTRRDQRETFGSTRTVRFLPAESTLRSPLQPQQTNSRPASSGSSTQAGLQQSLDNFDRAYKELRSKLQEHIKQESRVLATAPEVALATSTPAPSGSSVPLQAPMCTICMESFSSVQHCYSTKCGHLYCGECIDRIMLNTRQCAVCRQRLRASSYHRIFLN